MRASVVWCAGRQGFNVRASVVWCASRQGFSHRSGWMFDDFHYNTSGAYIPGLGVPNNTKTVVASECCSCVSGRYAKYYI